MHPVVHRSAQKQIPRLRIAIEKANRMLRSGRQILVRPVTLIHSCLPMIWFAPKTVQKPILCGMLSSPLSRPIPAKSVIQRTK
jgi:hypothetical protein